MRAASALLVAALGLALLPGPAQPQPRDEPGQARARDARPDPEVERADPAPAPPAPGVLYAPPRRGSPRAKVGGGVRGAATQPAPLTLAPPHLALTARRAPRLFWYLGALPGAGTETVFTLGAVDAVDPLVEQTLARPETTGFQLVDLALLGVELAPETEYEWSIAIVQDPRRRDLDLVDSASLMLVASELPADADAAAWAAQSVWYEALASAIAAVEADPTSETARAELSALLQQSELEAALP